MKTGSNIYLTFLGMSRKNWKDIEDSSAIQLYLPGAK